MSGRPAHWLDDGAILIVVRGSPLDEIARDASRLASARPIVIAGIPFDVVDVKALPADPSCTRVRLKRQGDGMVVGGPSDKLTAAMAKMTNHDFRIAMAILGLSLDAMAAVLGIGRRQVAHYRKDLPLPPHIALAVRQLLAVWPRGWA